jgi:chromate reductase, NAD(P)H dehydrogenase (quinone)
MLWPLTKCSGGTRIGAVRPGSASSGVGILSFFDEKNMAMPTIRTSGAKLRYVVAVLALLGICGSMRKASHNRGLLETLREVLAGEASLAIWDSLDLPIFSSDMQDPAAVHQLKQAIRDAHGVVFAVPEYNYSIPGGLKNALDWVSRPPASSPLRRKPVGIVGAASGMSGTIRAQTHLRQILLYSDCAVLGQPEVLIPRAHERFDATGVLVDESTRNLIGSFGMAFVTFVAQQLAHPGASSSV